jgi:drug/metabolite transporter (DMT)-like permease
VWVLISLAAGLLQTARNGLARSLSGVLPATLLSWSRFAFNLPFSTALILIIYSVDFDGPPTLPARFLLLSLIAGIGQLLGNVALITSFRLATFAQAIVVHKTEVALAAITGFLFFSETPSALGWLGIFASALGVALIGRASAAAKDPDSNLGWSELLSANRGTGLALVAAAMLVVAGFGIQQATEALADANPLVGLGWLCVVASVTGLLPIQISGSPASTSVGVDRVDQLRGQPWVVLGVLAELCGVCESGRPDRIRRLGAVGDLSLERTEDPGSAARHRTYRRRHLPDRVELAVFGSAVVCVSAANSWFRCCRRLLCAIRLGQCYSDNRRRGRPADVSLAVSARLIATTGWRLPGR